MTQTNTIYEDLVIRDAQANAALGRVSQRVGMVSNAIGGLKRILGGASGAVGAGLGIAGVFGVVDAVRGTEALYQKIGRIRAVTGAAADEAHGLIDAFELTGNENAEQTITRLARLSQLAKGGSKEAEKLRYQLGRMGVDSKGSATDTLVSMSKAVQGGKIGIAGLAKTFKIPLNQAADLMKTLQAGPTRLRSIINETKTGADVVNEAALANFEQMMQARRELKDAWEGVVGTLYKSLLPGATRFVQAFKSGLDSILPIAETVGSVLSNHMGTVVALSKAYLGYLVAAKTVGFFGGDLGGMMRGQFGGILSRRGAATIAKQAGPWSQNLGQGFASIANIASIRGAFAGRTGVMARTGSSAAQMLGDISPFLGRMAASTVSFRALGAVIGRLGVAGLAIGVAVRGFQILKEDIGGHRTRISAVLGSISDKFSGISKTMKPVLNLMSKVFGEYLTAVARFWLYVLEYWLKAVNGFLRIVKAVAYFVAELVTTKPWNWGTSMWTRAWSKAGESIADGADDRAKKKGGGDPTKPGGVYQDFRGSEFNITQKFAEGIDPGRVSVAFTEDIARVGEMKIQSGQAPVFAVRGLR